MSQTSIADNQDLTPFVGVLIRKLLTATATSEETGSTEIPFGVMVQHGVLEDSALLLAGAGAVDLIGIVVHSHAHAIGTELGDGLTDASGLKANATFTLLRKGTIYVHVEDAVTPASEVHVRHTVDTAPLDIVGRFRGAAVANETFDISAIASFRTITGVGGIATLELDMTNLAGVALDT